jgi:hypothetical protein
MPINQRNQDRSASRDRRGSRGGARSGAEGSDGGDGSSAALSPPASVPWEEEWRLLLRGGSAIGERPVLEADAPAGGDVPAGARPASSSARSRSPPPVAPLTPGAPSRVALRPCRSDVTNRCLQRGYDRLGIDIQIPRTPAPAAAGSGASCAPRPPFARSCAVCNRGPVSEPLALLAAHGIHRVSNIGGVSISTREPGNICAGCTRYMLHVHRAVERIPYLTGRVHLCPGCGLQHGEPVSSNPSDFCLATATLIAGADETSVDCHRCGMISVAAWSFRPDYGS